VELVPDFNRDGVIDDRDRGKVTETEPWRWWINDDSDNGDAQGEDRPGAASPNYADATINGTRDLADWFPLSLEIGSLVDVLPPENYRYELRSSDSSVNVLVPTMGTVAVKLTESNSRAYITNLSNAQSLAGPLAQVLPLTAAATLTDEFLTTIKTDRSGVILVEGRTATAAGGLSKLELHVIRKTSGQDVCQVKFPMRLSGVEQMYRQLNLRDTVSGLMGRKDDAAPAASLGEPANLPDKLCSNKWNVFVIGSNVSGQASRAWNAEMFKRHYQSGSKAKFVGVSWFGDPYYGNESGVYDYHYCIINAFRSGPALASAINGLSPAGPKMISGHSAANIVIATAMHDNGLAVDQFWMLDAAIAMEAFDASTASNAGMFQPPWTPYASRSWTTRWHANPALGNGDGRKLMTWNDRFAGISDKTYNFYSASEDVLRRHDGELNFGVFEALGAWWTGGRFAWAYQEKMKGLRYTTGIAGGAHVGSSYGGWKFTDSYYDNQPPAPPNTHTPSAAESATIPDATLLTKPVFDPGYHLQFSPPPPNSGPKVVHQYAPAWVVDLTDTDATKASSAAQTNRSQLLAEMIPARALPAGANRQERFGDRGNFNMPAQYMTQAAQWPRTSEFNGYKEWKHSDVKDVGYPHLYKLFDKLKELGGLNQ
jgi:hypothetical protein